MRVENFLLRKGRTFGFKSLMTEPLGQWLRWKSCLVCLELHTVDVFKPGWLKQQKVASSVAAGSLSWQWQSARPMAMASMTLPSMVAADNMQQRLCASCASCARSIHILASATLHT